MVSIRVYYILKFTKFDSSTMVTILFSYHYIEYKRDADILVTSG